MTGYIDTESSVAWGASAWAGNGDTNETRWNVWLAKERRSQLNNTVELSLSKTDKVAIIDEEDMPRVMAFSVSWYYHKERGYAFTNKTSIDLGRRITVELHRFIAGTPQGFDTDHVNGDKLDNRKDNLRICSRLENLQNRKARRQFTGVYRLPRNCGYAATIQKKWLGQFETSEDAARAYNRASREITGGNIPVNDVPDPFGEPKKKHYLPKCVYPHKPTKMFTVRFRDKEGKIFAFGYYQTEEDAKMVADHIRTELNNGKVLNRTFVRLTKREFKHLRRPQGNPNFKPKHLTNVQL